MGLITRVASAKKGTKSLKTTIPEGIAEFLELSDKDELEWKMDTHRNERSAIVLKKTESISSLELARYSAKQKRKLRGDT
jgi:bifunctional DNA-binding transcriptional regulator/antitoxin component of YhaV-PrlF toxin-antitoxin module